MSEDFSALLDNSDTEHPFSGLLDAQPIPAPKIANKNFITDTKTDLRKGILSIPGVAVGLADMGMGLAGYDRPIDKITGAIGKVTGFQPGKWAEEEDKNYSAEHEASNQAIDKAWDDPNTNGWDVAKAYAVNPRATLGTVVESLPSMLAGGAIGRAATGLNALAKTGTAAEIAKRAVLAGSVGEGAVMAGQSMENIDKSVDPQKAALAALGTGIAGAVIGNQSGKLAKRLGFSDIDAISAGGLQAGLSDATQPLAKRIIGGAIQEGPIEEGLQSIAETGLQNLAEDKPVTQGMGRNFVEGSLAGTVMGGGVNAFSGPLSKAANKAPATDINIDNNLNLDDTANVANVGENAGNVQDNADNRTSEEKINRYDELYNKSSDIPERTEINPVDGSSYQVKASPAKPLNDKEAADFKVLHEDADVLSHIQQRQQQEDNNANSTIPNILDEQEYAPRQPDSVDTVEGDINGQKETQAQGWQAENPSSILGSSNPGGLSGLDARGTGKLSGGLPEQNQSPDEQNVFDNAGYGAEQLNTPSLEADQPQLGTNYEAKNADEETTNANAEEKRLLAQQALDQSGAPQLPKGYEPYQAKIAKSSIKNDIDYSKLDDAKDIRGNSTGWKLFEVNGHVGILNPKNKEVYSYATGNSGTEKQRAHIVMGNLAADMAINPFENLPQDELTAKKIYNDTKDYKDYTEAESAAQRAGETTPGTLATGEQTKADIINPTATDVIDGTNPRGITGERPDEGQRIAQAGVTDSSADIARGVTGSTITTDHKSENGGSINEIVPTPAPSAKQSQTTPERTDNQVQVPGDSQANTALAGGTDGQVQVQPQPGSLDNLNPSKSTELKHEAITEWPTAKSAKAALPAGGTHVVVANKANKTYIHAPKKSKLGQSIEQETPKAEEENTVEAGAAQAGVKPNLKTPRNTKDKFVKAYANILADKGIKDGSIKAITTAVTARLNQEASDEYDNRIVTALNNGESLSKIAEIPDHGVTKDEYLSSYPEHAKADASVEYDKAVSDAKAKGLVTRNKATQPQDATKGADVPVMTEEQYLATNGASRQDIGEAALHRSSNKKSPNTHKKQVEAQAKKDHELIIRRAKLRKEYEEKIASGEIRKPTAKESLISTANGHPDNESTQAARRLLDKKGINWQQELDAPKSVTDTLKDNEQTPKNSTSKLDGDTDSGGNDEAAGSGAVKSNVSSAKEKVSEQSVLNIYESGAGLEYEQMDAIKPILEAQPSLSPIKAARLKEAHKSAGRDVKRSTVVRKLNDVTARRHNKLARDTPQYKKILDGQISRLQHDLSLFDEPALPNKASAPQTAQQDQSTDSNGKDAEKPAKKLRITPLKDDRIATHTDSLTHFAKQSGWAQKGGLMLRDDKGKVTRTTWIPTEEWYLDIPQNARMNNQDTIHAAAKAINGNGMTAQEKRAITALLDVIDYQDSAEFQDQQRAPSLGFDEDYYDSEDNRQELIAQAEDLVNDVPYDDMAGIFDLPTITTLAGEELTYEQRQAIEDDIFGASTKMDSGVKEVIAKGQDEGIESSGREEGVIESELASYTEAELADRAREQEQRDKQAKTAELKAKKKDSIDRGVNDLADAFMGKDGGVENVFGFTAMDNIDLGKAEKAKPITDEDSKQIDAEIKAAERLAEGVPDLKLLKYNLESDKLEWADGTSITNSELNSIIKRANDFIAMQYDKEFPQATRPKGDKPTRIGSATIKRAAFIQSLLQSEGGSSPKILAALVRKSGQSLEAIKDIIYSKSQSATTNPHTEQSLLSAMRKAMDGKYYSGWFSAVLDTGKVKIINSVAAKGIVGAKYSKYGTTWETKDDQLPSYTGVLRDYAKQLKSRGIQHLVSITREEADRFIGSIRITTKGTETTGLQGWFLPIAHTVDGDLTKYGVGFEDNERSQIYSIDEAKEIELLVKQRDIISVQANIPNGTSVITVQSKGESQPDALYSKNGDIVAFYNPADDTSYFVFDNISQDASAKELSGLLSHEIAIHQLRLLRSDKEFQALLKQVERLSKVSGSKMEQAAARVPKDTKADHVIEESLAYFSELFPDHSITKKFIQLVRKALRAIGKTLPVLQRAKWIRWSNTLSEDDIISMANDALRSAPSSLLYDNVGRENDSIRFEQDQQRFYSALRKAFRDAPDKVFGNPLQVKAWLNSNAAKFDVKKDEIYWSGVNDWLDTLQGKVSKDDVLSFLDANGVQIEDVVLGGVVDNREIESITLSDDEDDGVWRVIFNDGEVKEFPQSKADDKEEAERLARKTNGDAKHNTNSLTLPGGADYRELVVTIPTIEPHKADDSTHFGDVSGGKHVAWVRMNSRTDADGNTTQFLEEVQSQRGQDGRKEGFGVIQPSNEQVARLKELDANGDNLSPSEQRELDGLINKMGGIKGVPPAPFVTDSNNKATNAYISLIMKKAISAAIDAGHTSVSWTTGDQQSDRYDLSKHISKITYSNRKVLRAYSNNGEKIIDNELDSDAELDDIIGKDVAKKLLEAEYTTSTAQDEHEVRALTNQNLKVGSAWTQAMYGDENGLNAQGQPALITQAANAIAKKFGGKMGSIFTKTDTTFNRKNIKLQGVGDNINGYQQFIVIDEDNGAQLSPEVFRSYQEADKFKYDLLDKLAHGFSQQPALIITPQMRAKIIAEGMPLFSKTNSLDSTKRLAPNGEPSNLNAVQYAQVRAPEFKKWFGGSRSVDENNEPRAMYHGTAADISEFNGFVNWFSESPKFASEYAEMRDYGKGDGGNVVQAFIKAERPFDADSLKKGDNTVASFVMEMAQQAKDNGVKFDNSEAKRLLDIVRVAAREEESGPHYAPHQFWMENHYAFGEKGSKAIADLFELFKFDSINFTEDGNPTVGVLSSSQVKSATSNNGQFDSSNNDIRYSKMGDAENNSLFDDDPDDSTWSKTVIDKLSKLTDKVQRSVYGALTVRQLTKLGRHVMPQLKDFSDFLQKREALQNHYLNESGRLVDSFWRKLDKTTLTRTNKLINDSSLGDIDASRDWFGMEAQDKGFMVWSQHAYDRGVQDSIKTLADSLGGKVIGKTKATFTDEEQAKQFLSSLKKKVESESDMARFKAHEKQQPRFNALSKDAQHVYKESLALHEKIYTAKMTALEDRISDAISDKKKRKEFIATLRQQFETNKLNWYYAPLSRFGDYWLHGITEDGKPYFETFESEKPMNKAKDEFKGRIIGSGLKVDGLKSLGTDMVSEGFVADVQELLLKANAPKELQDDIYQMFLATLPAVSMRTNQIHRQGVAGFDKDAMRAFADSTWHGAKQLSNLAYNSDMTKVLTDAKAAIEVADSSRKMSKITDENAAAATLKNEWEQWPVANLEAYLEDSESDLHSDMLRLRKKFNDLNENDAEAALDKLLDKNNRLLTNAKRIQSQEKGSVKASKIVTELNRAFEDMQSPAHSPVAQALMQFNFITMLGLSPAFFVVNTVQTPGVAMPIAFGRFGSVGNVTREYGKSYHDFMVSVLNGRKDEFGNLSMLATLQHQLSSSTDVNQSKVLREEINVLKRFMDEGDVDNTQGHDNIGVAENGAAHGGMLMQVAKLSSFMAHHSERMNREITLMANYRLARKSGESMDKSIATARELNIAAHLDYMTENTARFMRSPAAKVLTQFMKYKQGMYFTWLTSAFDAVKGQTLEERQEARRTLIGLLTMQTALAGTLGIPLMGALIATLNVICGMGDDDDDKWDTEKEMRLGLHKLLEPMGEAGNKLAESILFGAVNALTPIELHSRMDLSDVLIRDPIKEREGRDAGAYMVAGLAGPSASNLVDLYETTRLANDGQWSRALETLPFMPKVGTDFIKAIRYANNDARTQSDKIIKEMSTPEVLLQALGFSSSELSRKYDENSYIKKAEADVSGARSKIIEKIAEGRIKSDAAMVKEGTQERLAWMKKHPEYPITGKSIQQSIRSHNRADKQMKGTGIRVNPKLDYLREENSFN